MWPALEFVTARIMKWKLGTLKYYKRTCNEMKKITPQKLHVNRQGQRQIHPL